MRTIKVNQKAAVTRGDKETLCFCQGITAKIILIDRKVGTLRANLGKQIHRETSNLYASVGKTLTLLLHRKIENDKLIY